MKKVLSLILACSLLMGMTLSAAAETASAPSVEDILNEYHSKAFTAQNGGVSAYARSGKTLEQETVEELTAAGYEAYNVTADNYEALQETLKTDFADMGLDPEGSYIIVINAEKNATKTNPNSRVIDPPGEDFVDDGTTVPEGSIPYTYEGVTYYLRTITAVPANGTNSISVNLRSKHSASFVNNLFNSATTLKINSNNAIDAVGTLRNLYCYSNSGTLSLVGSALWIDVEATWTVKSIQVFNEAEATWTTKYSVEYAAVHLNSTASLHNSGTGVTTSCTMNTTKYVYSRYYTNMDWYLMEAASRANGTKGSDITGALNFVFVDANGNSTKSFVMQHF